MAKNSKIEWTDATWNPWYGCSKVSVGCKNCYMFRWARQFGKDPMTITRSKTFDAPLHWKEPRRIFVCSLSDFFHLDVPWSWREEAMEIIRQCPHHTFMILTKRIGNVKSLMPDWWHICENIWLGVTAENQEMADRHIPRLLEIPATIRFVSAEPLLGPIEFTDRPWWDWRYTWGFYPPGFFTPPIDWIITGGESGPAARPCDLDWVRDIRDQCKAAGIAFFHKQHGGNKKIGGSWGGRDLDGVVWNAFPFCVRCGKEFGKWLR